MEGRASVNEVQLKTRVVPGTTSTFQQMQVKELIDLSELPSSHGSVNRMASDLHLL